MGQYCSSELNLVVAESGASHLSHYQGRYVMAPRPDVDQTTVNPRSGKGIYYKNEDNVIWLNGNWRVGPLNTWDGSQEDGDIIASVTIEQIEHGGEYISRVPRCPHNITLIEPSGEEIDMDFKWKYKTVNGDYTEAQPFGVYTLPGIIEYLNMNLYGF